MLFARTDLENVVEFFHADPIPRYSEADIEEMRELGASEDDIEAALAEELEPEAYEVLPENWPAVQLYLACYGQFRISPTGQVWGFDIPAVDIEIRRSELEVTSDTWERFKTLQVLTVHLLNQRHQSNHAHE